MPKVPKDVRSTGRKRARKVLKDTGRPYKCECRDEHSWHLFKDLCGYTPSKQSRSSTLDANHINKNLLDVDPANLEWLCRRCHKAKDSKTAKGKMSEEASSALYGDLLEGYS